ncbi:major facilitator superfamily domain-containing protein [Chaetomidium leptoderma]|uniref:Major facilitator superfamily domain-containing protein n=1 Tax=Chaetomidium leptoderma TaxID=669021 RepID=A0AAN6VFJ3_9PEZI|nr:major facilitator superfamily domain-containing protein [Chaetomidium leptoderma]
MADTKEGGDSAQIENTGLSTTDLEASPRKLAADQDAVEPAPDRTKNVHPRGFDKATEFLKQADHEVVVTHGDSRRVAKFIYCLQSLDKNTLSYAAVFGLITDTGLKGDQYSWLGSVVYLAQLVFQPLIAYILVKFPIGKFLAVMVFAWGAILCGMTAAHDFTGLLISRLILGIFEAAVAPTFVAIIQMWYRRREQTKRNAAWYAMLGVVNIIGSLLTYGLGHINSGVLRSYQIIFLFCGLLTVTWSIVTFILMPDSPMTAKFLKSDDKLIAIERLRMNQQGIASGVWKWDHVWEAMLDLKTWLWFSIMFIISIPSGGISTFGPLIIESFGFDRFTTILFNIPFGAVQMIATLGGAWLSDKIKMKAPVLILLCLGPIAGCSILLAVGRAASDRAVLLFGYYIISLYPGISPLIYSWSGQNTGGDTKRKVTTAMLFIGSNGGNVIGPLLFRPDEKPRYTRGLTANLVLFVALAVVVGLGALWIKFLNLKHAKARLALGKPEKIVDLSMADARDEDDGDILNQAADHVGERGFEDLTDLKNEDFIYVY